MKGVKTMNKFYSLATNDRKGTLTIYGDITSFPWLESDVSAYNLVEELNALDVDCLDVYINSYGGEVSEGLAIYNALKRHKAEVTTYVDGFACSIASVIAMAGDKRVMYDSSLLMIHNAWTYVNGNADDMRKAADDLDKITSASIAAYMSVVNISEQELKAMLDNETWLKPDEALEKGFITEIRQYDDKSGFSQSARMTVMQKICGEKSNNDNSLAEKICELSQRIDTGFSEMLEKIAEFKEKSKENVSFDALEKFIKKM